MADVGERQHSALFLTRRILTQVWHHPNNRGRRGRAVAGALAWQVTKRLRRTQQVRTVYGTMRIAMDPRFGSASNIVYFGERFDRDEMGFLARSLRPGDRFADVGANIGTYTLLAASITGPDGRIDAVEAVPGTAAALRANVARNDLGGRVRVHEVAVGAAPGRVRFRVDQDVSNHLATAGDPVGSTVEVAVARLDDVLGPEPIAIAKLDVEGAETEALAGMRAHLHGDHPPVLILEVLANTLARQGSSVDALLALLAEAGYELARWSEDRAELTWLDPAHARRNVLAIPLRRRHEVEARLAAR